MAQVFHRYFTVLPIATVGDRTLNYWFDLLELLFQAFMEKYVVFVALLRQFR